ncbi:MAG: hypothetical protein HYY16_01595, partial [Planctomycetes bacterium]|nr:hypothetical protein [Planctomycetota bacterium]
MTAGAWVIATAVYLILAYFGGLAALRLLVALAGSRQRARLLAALRLVDHANVSLAKSMPPLSLAILPGRNPAALYETISTAVTLEYPGLEIIVVLDAGRADIFGPLIPAFELSRAYRVYKHPVRHERIRAVYASTRFPQLLLIDKPEGDPADDLNAALNVANAPFFMFIEAGTRLNPQSLRALFLTWSQAPETTAIGIAPSRIRPIVASAVMETATQEFPLSTDWSWATLASSLCGTNALAVYRKKSLELVGGFSIRARNPRVDTPIRLIEKLRRLGIMAGTVFCPVPIASESCPGTVDLIRRHQAGMLDALSHHGGEAMSSGSLGTAGAIVYLVLFEAARPVIESAAFLFLYIAALQGWVDPTTLLMTIAVILAALVMGTGFGTFSQAGFAETDATGSGTPGRLLATVLSPLGAHPVALWGRLLGLMDHLTLPPKKIRTPTVAAAADQSQARPSTSVIAVQPDLPTPTHPAPPPLAWAATGLRSRHAPPPPAPAVEEAPVEVEP